MDSFSDPIIEPDPSTVPLGALQASLFRLMTLYSVMPCLGKARSIVHLLSALLRHPDLQTRPSHRQIYLQMLDTWNQLAQEPAAVRWADDGSPLPLH